MPRKLKTYTTSAGFFDLAIAAPSMKAALEAWGSNSNLFHQGFAKLSDDPDIVADTMARPGVVLRRPVGTNGRFSEHAKLPSNLLAGNANRKPEKVRTRKDRAASRRIDEKTARQAAFAFEEEQQRRERQTQKEDAARERELATPSGGYMNNTLVGFVAPIYRRASLRITGCEVSPTAACSAFTLLDGPPESALRVASQM